MEFRRVLFRSPRPARGFGRRGRPHRRRARADRRRLVAAPRLEHAGRARRARRGEGRSGTDAPARRNRRAAGPVGDRARAAGGTLGAVAFTAPFVPAKILPDWPWPRRWGNAARSEEHTSELPSL